LSQPKLLKLQIESKGKEKHACDKASTRSEYKSTNHSQENLNIKQNVPDDPAIEEHGNDHNQNRKNTNLLVLILSL